MKKLTFRQAKKLFDSGKRIYLKTSKVSIQVLQHSPWLSWYEVQKDDNPETFDQIVNSFSYYNCSKDMGLKVNYYAYL